MPARVEHAHGQLHSAEIVYDDPIRTSSSADKETRWGTVAREPRQCENRKADHDCENGRREAGTRARRPVPDSVPNQMRCGPHHLAKVPEPCGGNAVVRGA